MGVGIPYMVQPFNNQCFTLEMKISLSEKQIVLGWHDQNVRRSCRSYTPVFIELIKVMYSLAWKLIPIEQDVYTNDLMTN